MPGKFKGRYVEHKKKTERDVISYEDMPLEDYEQEKTDISPEAVKKIIIGVCVALATGIIVFAFANRERFTWDNISTWWTYDVLGNAGNGYPVDIVGAEVASGNFLVSQGRVAYSSDTSFVTLNTTGREIANIQLSYSKPVMKSSGNRYLTYGLGGKGYQIQSFDEKIYEGEVESAILTGDISSDGVYCIVTEGNGFLSSLFVFNKNNNRIYKYSFSEYYIMTVALNDDGSGAVACGVTTDNGKIKTGVYVLDFSKEDPVSLYEINNDTIVDCKYLSSNRTALIGQTAAYIIKIGDDNYVTSSYEDKTLTNYCFNPDTSNFTVALSKRGDGRSCVLNTINDKGEIKSQVNTDRMVESLSMYKNVLAILDGNTAYVYNTDGKLIYTRNTGTGSKKIILTDTKHAYVLSVNQIRLFDLSKPMSTADTVVNKTER